MTALSAHFHGPLHTALCTSNYLASLQVTVLYVKLVSIEALDNFRLVSERALKSSARRAIEADNR